MVATYYHDLLQFDPTGIEITSLLLGNRMPFQAVAQELFAKKFSDLYLSVGWLYSKPQMMGSQYLCLIRNKCIK